MTAAEKNAFTPRSIALAVGLPAGTWRFTPGGDGSFELSARGQSSGAMPVRLPEDAALVLTQRGLIDITVIAIPPAFLTEIVAQRIDG